MKAPVDFVITWVDDQDAKWQAKKVRALHTQQVDVESQETCRFINSNELLYCVRSIYENCPWFNKIYIVSDEQIPDWLDLGNDRISIVNHRTIFGAKGTLPTFNSNAIESRLHHIPGLSEHYVALNDDFFIGRPLSRRFFFHRDGEAKLFLSRPESREKIEDAVSGNGDRSVSLYSSALTRTRRLVSEESGALILNTPKHTPRPFCKTSVFEVEATFEDIIDEALHHQFRERTGINFLALVAFFLVAKGHTVTPIRYPARRNSKHSLSSLDYLKVQPRDSKMVDLEYKLLRVIKPAFFCINDNEKTTDRNRADMVRELERYFPGKCPAER